MKNKVRKGKIIPNGVSLEKHEYDTVIFFTELGHDIGLIPQSMEKGQHRADAIIDGVIWEFKSPQGKSVKTLGYILSKAVKQSNNIIMDMRRSKVPQSQSLAKLEKEFALRKSIKRLKIITKKGKIIDFHR